MTIAHDARRIVEESIDSGIEIVNNKLHALKSKTDKEIVETNLRILQVARMVLDARLSLEHLMMVDDNDGPKNEEVKEEGDPDLFTGRETRTT